MLSLPVSSSEHQHDCRKNRGSIQRAMDNVKLTKCVCLLAIRSDGVLDKELVFVQGSCKANFCLAYLSNVILPYFMSTALSGFCLFIFIIFYHFLFSFLSLSLLTVERQMWMLLVLLLAAVWHRWWWENHPWGVHCSAAVCSGCVRSKHDQALQGDWCWWLRFHHLQ